MNTPSNVLTNQQSDHFVRLVRTPEDQLAFQQCMATAFSYSMDSASFVPKTSEELAAEPFETWVAGQPASSGYVVHDFDVWFNGHLVRTSGIGGVATLPPARSQGGIRAIFEEQLPDSYRKGYVFSMLFPFSHRFYRKFGYELVQRSHYFTVPLQSLAPFAQALPVTLVTEGAELQAIHDAFGKQCSLSIHRKPNQWHFVSKDPVKAVNFTYKIGDVAFLTIRAMDGEPDTLHVRDLGYSGKEGLRALLGFLYTMRASYEKARLCLPDSVPLADMIPECYEVKDTRSAHGMARIVNVRRALELMPYPGRDGSFTVKVSDAQILDNNHTFRVDYTAGGKEVSVTIEDDAARDHVRVTIDDTAAPDLTVSIQRLTQLVVGSLTLSQALWTDEVECSDPSKFDGLFPRRDIYFDDPF
ncbi:MAG: GNAT family N-acetyltransferase [Firmicutes bacterium]|nr:GNAT family N-acetyltransferase [Bacillota bacterium]